MLRERLLMLRQMWAVTKEMAKAMRDSNRDISVQGCVDYAIASSLVKLATGPMLAFSRAKDPQGPTQQIVTAACEISGIALEQMNCKPISIVQACVIEYGGKYATGATHRSYVVGRDIPEEWKARLIELVQLQLDPTFRQPPV